MSSQKDKPQISITGVTYDYYFFAQKVGQEPTVRESNECRLGTLGQNQLFKMASKMAAKYNSVRFQLLII